MKYLKKFEGLHQLEEHPDFGSHYMFFKNIESIKHYISEIEQLDPKEIGELLDNGHDWAADHMAVATDCIQQVSNFLRNEDTMHMDDQVDGHVEMEGDMYSEPVNPAENEEEIQDETEVETFKDFNKEK
jgi:hypothetical protein